MRRELLLTFGTRLLLVAVGLVAAVLTARFLGAEGRGQYYLALVFTTTAVQLACLGLPSSNTFLAAGDHSLLPKLNSLALWISLILGGVAAVCSAALVHAFNLLPALDWQLLALAALAIIPALYYLIAVNLLVGVGKLSAFNGYEFLSRVAPLLLMIVAALINPTPFTFVGATLLAAFAVSVMLFLALGHSVKLEVPDVALLKKNLGYGLRAYMALVLAFVLSRFNVFLLGSYGAIEELGQFSIAMQISDAMAILPASFALVLFPRLVRDADTREQSTLKGAAWIAGIMFVLCLLAWVLARPLVPLLFGEEFLPAVPILIWMLPGIFFVALISVLSQYLAATGFPWSLIATWAIGVLVVASLSLYLIPQYGAGGAAMSMSVAYFVVFLLVVSLSWATAKKMVY